VYKATLYTNISQAFY